ncbi:MAG: hypothetical protein LYZ70_07505 [Nitrososphaerales archaeon]|nr:hypothetical protein [Nitrososphaerales archaeon]
MPRAGILDYPSRDVDDCVGYIRKARSATNARTTSREDFAESIGQSVRGGGFGKLVASMTAYGLVETGAGRMTTTDLCEQILYGGPTEQRNGMEKAVRSVRLFGEIYERFKGEPSDDQLRIFLREKAHVEVAQADRIAAEVGKLLRRNFKHMMTTDFRAAPVPPTREGPSEGSLIGKLETADYGILNIKDEISMGLVISLLTQISKAKGWSRSGVAEREDNGSGQRNSLGEASQQPKQGNAAEGSTGK